jgi:hypothetical protein
MAMADDFIHDRRKATRVAFQFPVALRDTSHVWKGEVRNLSTTGCLIAVQARMAVGKVVELELKPGGMQAAVTIRGVVRHTPSLGVLGIEFDTARSEVYEKSVDLFEGLLAAQPRLAVEVKRRPTKLSKSTMLFLVADAVATPRPEESRLLIQFTAGKTLGELERAMGEKFRELMYLPFSMLDRGLLTTVKPSASGIRGSRR